MTSHQPGSRTPSHPERIGARAMRLDAGAARHNGIDAAMRLCLKAPIELNDCIEIALSASVAFRGNVIWVNGDNCGVAFETRPNGATLLTNAAADRRQAKEAGLPRPTPRPSGMGDRDSDAPEAIGRSPHENSFRYDSIFIPGLRVKVLLDGDREKRGVVRWSQDNIAELFMG